MTEGNKNTEKVVDNQKSLYYNRKGHKRKMQIEYGNKGEKNEF